MDFVFSRTLELVYRRLDSRQTECLSWWSNRLYGKGISGESFPGATFMLFDSIARKGVLVVLDGFAIYVDSEGEALTERQLFKISSEADKVISGLPLQPGKLYESVKLGNLVLRWMESGGFRQARVDEIAREGFGITAAARRRSSKPVAPKIPAPRRKSWKPRKRLVKRIHNQSWSVGI